MILAEAITEVRTLAAQLEDALAERTRSAMQVAEAERAYRRARGVAWVEQSAGTAGFREAQVDAVTADLRYARDLADGVHRSAGEAIRARVQQISMWQSLLSAHRAEAQFAARGPDVESPFDINRYPA